MPSTITDKQRILASEIRKDFDGQHLLNKTQVSQVLGIKTPSIINKWLSQLEPRVVNGRKYYLTLDVAGLMLKGTHENTNIIK